MDSEQYAEELRKTIRKLMNELTDNVALGNDFGLFNRRGCRT